MIEIILILLYCFVIIILQLLCICVCKDSYLKHVREYRPVHLNETEFRSYTV